MSNYYDDNFGNYNMDDDRDETVEFYHEVQKRSVWKVCSICGDKVKIMSHYDKCNSCCERMENGWQF